MQNIMRRDSHDFPMSRVIQSFFNDPFFAELPAIGRAAVEEGTLALDVSEDDSAVIVRASLPGFRKDDVDVEVHDGVLTIKAQHTEEKEENSERYYRRERRVGSLSRRVALPSVISEDKVEASLTDGVLTLRLPKIPTAQPKKVRIG
ncbi:MAG: Hsp20/alpha crystallin family protein [Planctomycetota bacterium]|nr:Hsp20/alpha crystallin family protein [Planctomycetota bacterium]